MKNHLTTLFIVRHNGSTGTFISNDPAAGIQHQNNEFGVRKLEHGVLMGSEAGQWEVAYLYNAQAEKGSPPLHCYHHTKGVQRISKQEAEELRLYKNQPIAKDYRAYIIPIAELQAQGRKPETRFVDNPEDAQGFLNDRVWKILVYNAANNALIKTFLK